MKLDIVATWPKKRPLQSYLDALAAAEASGQTINFRVAILPKWDLRALADRPDRHTPRCYMVHDGAVRGYNEISCATERGDNEVVNPEGGYWPAGRYVVRDPAWHAIEPMPMRGFQGWRWVSSLRGNQ